MVKFLYSVFYTFRIDTCKDLGFILNFFPVALCVPRNALYHTLINHLFRRHVGAVRFATRDFDIRLCLPFWLNEANVQDFCFDEQNRPVNEFKFCENG